MAFIDYGLHTPPGVDLTGDFTVPEDFDPIPPNQAVRWDDQRLLEHPAVPRDWEGETVVVIASGPSLLSKQLGLVNRARDEGRCKVIGVNNAWHRFKRLDAIYALDPVWWREYDPVKFYRNNPKFHPPEFWCAHQRAPVYDARFPGLMPMGDGANSGLHGVVLAARKGAAKIILLGFDYSVEHGRHWHRDHPAHMRNPDRVKCLNWTLAFHRLWELRFKDAPFKLVNCTPRTALRLIPRGRLEDELWPPQST